MKRLTKRIDGDAAFHECAGICATCTSAESFCSGAMVERLAAYEDTGLEPDEVTELMAAHGTAILKLSEYRSIGIAKHLLELAQAEKDGRLVVLQPNDPLTLEELREMDGEPVWIAGYGLNFYDIYQGEFPFGYASFYFGQLSFNSYQESWLAYRRKPEEATL